MDLPAALTFMLADAELIVTGWSADDDELTARVVKDAATETGRLTFRGVSHVNLPPALTIESIEARAPRDLPFEFWNDGTPKLSELGDADTAFLIFGAWGGRYFVIAEEIEYDLMQ